MTNSILQVRAWTSIVAAMHRRVLGPAQHRLDDRRVRLQPGQLRVDTGTHGMGRDVLLDVEADCRPFPDSNQCVELGAYIGLGWCFRKERSVGD